MAAGCACGSGSSYAGCCRPLHEGNAFPETPSQLVRARFCAFALKKVDYLWDTLHPNHPDRASPEADVKRDLRSAAATFKYVRLHILDQRENEVLFLAEIYRGGKQHSFLEHSTFGKGAARWLYLSGRHRAWDVKDLRKATWSSVLDEPSSGP